jgi:hypothetical protein
MSSLRARSAAAGLVDTTLSSVPGREVDPTCGGGSHRSDPAPPSRESTTWSDSPAGRPTSTARSFRHGASIRSPVGAAPLKAPRGAPGRHQSTRRTAIRQRVTTRQFYTESARPPRLGRLAPQGSRDSVTREAARAQPFCPASRATWPLGSIPDGVVVGAVRVRWAGSAEEGASRRSGAAREPRPFS